MDELISKTLQQIKQQHITPVPAWKLRWQSYIFWAIFAVMVVFTAISFSMIFHLTQDVDWGLYEYVKRSRIVFLFSVLPIFWIILLGLFALISYKNIRFTAHGYRYSRFKIAGITIGISLGLGTIIYITQAADQIGRTVSKNMSGIPYIITSKEKLWMQPEMGLLSGEIIVVTEDRIDLIDFSGQTWNVIPDKETVVRPAIPLRKKDRIKVIGDKVEAYIFHAREIRPWECTFGPECDDKNSKLFVEML